MQSGRRHFISVLGTTPYSEVFYGEDEKKTRFVQEAVIRQKLGKIHEEDVISILVTDEAYRKNYITREEIVNDADEEKIKRVLGLKDILIQNCGISEKQLHEVRIPTGKNDDELLECFNCIYDTFENGDRVCVDVTHSFRSLPILLLAVLCFAKTVKNIEVTGIYYGAFEARVNDRAPIFDLSMFFDLIEWTHAANSFSKYGNGEEMLTLSEQYHRSKADATMEAKRTATDLENVAKRINGLTRAIWTSRGCYAEGYQSARKPENSIKKAYESYEGVIKKYYGSMEKRDGNEALPFDKLVDLIEDKASKMNGETNFEIGMQTIEWSLDHHMTQQGYTALNETIKTFLCNQFNLDETDESDREDICKRICILIGKGFMDMKGRQEFPDKEKAVREQAYEDWKAWAQENPKLLENKRKCGIQESEIYQTVSRIASDVPLELVNIMQSVSNSRNSMNHFGYSNIMVFGYDNLEKNLKKLYRAFKKVTESYV